MLRRVKYTQSNIEDLSPAKLSDCLILYIVVMMWEVVASTNDQSVDGCIKDRQNHYTAVVFTPEHPIDLSIMLG